MKLTKQTLKRIIKEELEAVLNESTYASMEDYINSMGPLKKVKEPTLAWMQMQSEMIDALDAVGITTHIDKKDKELLYQWLSSLGVSNKDIGDMLSKFLKSAKKSAKIASLDNKLVYFIKNEIEKQRKKGHGGQYVDFNGDQIDFYIGNFAYDEEYSDEEVREAVSILSKEMPNINFIYEL